MFQQWVNCKPPNFGQTQKSQQYILISKFWKYNNFLYKVTGTGEMFWYTFLT